MNSGVMLVLVIIMYGKKQMERQVYKQVDIITINVGLVVVVGGGVITHVMRLIR